MRQLEFEHPADPERDFEREIGRLEEPRIGDDAVTVARRKALAEIIERAHSAWAKRGAR